MAQARTQVTQAAYAQAQTAWQAASASAPAAIEAAMRAGGWIAAGSFYQEIANVQSALMRTASPREEYTRQLIAASEGYNREAARRMVTYE